MTCVSEREKKQCDTGTRVPDDVPKKKHQGRTVKTPHIYAQAHILHGPAHFPGNGAAERLVRQASPSPANGKTGKASEGKPHLGSRRSIRTARRHPPAMAATTAPASQPSSQQPPPPTAEAILRQASRDPSAAAAHLPELPPDALVDILSTLSAASPAGHLALLPAILAL